MHLSAAVATGGSTALVCWTKDAAARLDVQESLQYSQYCIGVRRVTHSNKAQ